MFLGFWFFVVMIVRGFLSCCLLGVNIGAGVGRGEGEVG